MPSKTAIKKIEIIRDLDRAAAESEARARSPEHKAEQAAELAEMVKKWQGDMPAKRAAQVLGIPKRTLDNIRAGRGFPYPILLTHAIRSFD